MRVTEAPANHSGLTRSNRRAKDRKDGMKGEQAAAEDLGFLLCCATCDMISTILREKISDLWTNGNFMFWRILQQQGFVLGWSLGGLGMSALQVR